VRAAVILSRAHPEAADAYFECMRTRPRSRAAPVSAAKSRFNFQPGVDVSPDIAAVSSGLEFDLRSHAGRRSTPRDTPISAGPRHMAPHRSPTRGPPKALAGVTGEPRARAVPARCATGGRMAWPDVFFETVPMHNHRRLSGLRLCRRSIPTHSGGIGHRTLALVVNHAVAGST